ncbi:MAG: hypothetical protein OER96_07875 [Gammaproteobacteria bacterium]|nr:hypothetical protein [Gammaproteobacteria bacterium]
MRNKRSNATANRILLCACVVVSCVSACSTSSVDQIEAQPGSKGRVVMEYGREGGLLPLATEWKLFDDGRLVRADGKTHKLDQDLYSNLWALCRRVEKDYASSTEHFCADCRTVTLQLDCDGAKRQVTVIEGLAGTPQHILELLSVIRSAIKTGEPVN